MLQSLLLLLLVIADQDPELKLAKGKTMKAGQVLMPGEYLTAGVGSGYFSLQENGNLVICRLSPDCDDHQEEPAWQSETDGNPGAHLIVEQYGAVNLIPWEGSVKNNVGTEQWIAGKPCKFHRQCNAPNMFCAQELKVCTDCSQCTEEMKQQKLCPVKCTKACESHKQCNAMNLFCSPDKVCIDCFECTGKLEQDGLCPLKCAKAKLMQGPEVRQGTALWSTRPQRLLHKRNAADRDGCSQVSDICRTKLIMGTDGVARLRRFNDEGVAGKLLWKSSNKPFIKPESTVNELEAIAVKALKAMERYSTKTFKRIEGGTNTCPDSNLFFVHIPKTGGGTVEQSICPMQHRYTGNSKVQHQFHFKMVNLHASHLLLEENRQMSSDGLKGAVTFAMMRDPYDRFVSEANYRRGRTSLQQQIDVCQNVSVHINHDHFVHCRPQTDYVGIHGEKVDHLFLMFDGVKEFLQTHGGYQLANISKFSHVSIKRWTAADLTAGQRAWIESVYAKDFALMVDKFQYTATIVEHEARVEMSTNMTLEIKMAMFLALGLAVLTASFVRKK